MTEHEAYRRLVAAAALLTGQEFFSQTCVADIELTTAAQIVAENRAALTLARAALAHRCAIPLQYSEAFLATHCADYGHFRHLARVLVLDARTAHAAGQVDDAARTGYELLVLGNAVRRGGIIVDFLVANSITSLGLDVLRRVRAALPPDARKWLIGNLAAVELEADPLAFIFERDRHWDDTVERDKSPLPLSLPAADEMGVTEEVHQALAASFQAILDLPSPGRRAFHEGLENRNLAQLRMLAIDLAVRAYRESRGKNPSLLAQLGPEFLSPVPLDPFTGRPFTYRPGTAGNTFDLYSPGPGQIDHGGLFGPWSLVASGQADFYLDSWDHA